MDENIDVPSVGNKLAGYKYEFRHDGVYLTVYPSVMPDMFELSDMRQILQDYSVHDYDIEALARTVREASGKPVKLANDFKVPEVWKREKVPEESGNSVQIESGAENMHHDYGIAVIEISKDRMEAKLHFELKPGQDVPKPEAVYEEIKKKNINFGVNDLAVGEACRTGKAVMVARGVAPVNGIDAKIIRHFEMGEKGKPVVNEYDQADYKNLNIFLAVKKGQILAERIPHTRGTPGTDVFGNAITAKNGKPKPVPNGKNTSIKDENYVIADIDGQIVDTGSKISVDPHLDIRGDVGVATGNIDFAGGVSIGGNVDLGFTVKATGDIDIKGMVSGAIVEGRNVYIKGGIQGMNRGHIKAEEDVCCAFVENGNIEAGENVYVTDVAMHSTIRAGKMLSVEEGKGQIFGGLMAAGECIKAKQIGNAANIATRLTVGVNPLLQKKYQETLKEYLEAKKRLEQLNRTLNTLGKIDINLLPPDKVDKINALVRSQFPLAGTVERNEKLLKEMDEEMQKMKKGTISVRDTMYPGVKLSINSILKNVQSEEKHCTQYLEDDFIRTGPY